MNDENRNDAGGTAGENERLRRENERLQRQNYQLRRRAEEAEETYRKLTGSVSWKAGAPVRAAGRMLLRFRKAGKLLHREGILGFLRRVWRKLFGCGSYMSRFALSERDRRQQRETVFREQVKVSVLVPLYNTPERFLKDLVESLKKQTYPNWELCLADGSDDAHASVGEQAGAYAAADARIRYRKLRKNLGISENTNACAEMASGELLALLDHDDFLKEDALFEVVKAYNETGAPFLYTDEAMYDDGKRKVSAFHFKPDFSPDTLRSYNYICHLSVFETRLFKEAGGFRPQCDGSQDYDLILRLTERASSVAHVAKPLYFWRSHGGSVAGGVEAKPYCIEAAKLALSEHLQRVGLRGEVEEAGVPSCYRIRYEIEGEPLISILIPTCDHAGDLKKCISSIQRLSTYPHYEIIVIENNSVQEETFAYYRELEGEPNVKVIRWEREFNYSAINNFGFQHAAGEYILLLNNDMEVITPGWLEEMLMFAQRRDVGAVGAKLYYPDDTIQHAGVIMGLGGVAGHSHKYFPKEDDGYLFRLKVAQDLSAVTAACMLMRADVYREAGGLDEAYAVAFNDVDLCMRICEKGYRIVFTPFAELYHYESKSRGEEDTKEKQLRFQGEVERFYERWEDVLRRGDPCYSPNLTLRAENFAYRSPDEDGLDEFLKK